jgi:hypothetical protein
MTNRIKPFLDFINETSGINEGDGFGTYPYLLKKSGNVYSYFFKIDQEGGKQKSYMLSIGKYSEFQDTPGPKNSYAVMRINEISEQNIEDIAIGKSEIPLLNREKFNVDGNTATRLIEVCAKALLDYLQANAQVIRIFDEMQVNANFEDRDYLADVKATCSQFLGQEWSVQEGPTDETLIISR